MTTKRRVLLDGNGSSQINVEGLGVYVPASELAQIKKNLGTEIQQLKDQRNAMQVDLEIADKTAETLKTVIAERDQLTVFTERMKIFLSQQVVPNLTVLRNDYPQCLGIDIAITDANEFMKAIPSNAIEDIRAKAVMNFAELHRGAYLSGFVTAELTVYDVYQFARSHVKDNYSYNTTPWTGEDADKAKAATCEIIALALESINPVEFVAMALRHTTVSSDFDYQDVKDAFKHLADEYRQAAKDGAA